MVRFKGSANYDIYNLFSAHVGILDIYMQMIASLERLLGREVAVADSSSQWVKDRQGGSAFMIFEKVNSLYNLSSKYST